MEGHPPPPTVHEKRGNHYKYKHSAYGKVLERHKLIFRVQGTVKALTRLYFLCGWLAGSLRVAYWTERFQLRAEKLAIHCASDAQLELKFLINTNNHTDRLGKQIA